MNPDDQQAIYGIIGNPLQHSLSPVMHNAAFKALKVDAVYKAFPLETHELSDFFSALKSEDSPIFGLNVTVPYKEKVLEYLDGLAPLAQKIGAVNTIVITNNRTLTGYNTDAPGFIAHLNELKFNTAGADVCILGAGGSTRAILTALCIIPERPSSIRIFNRTPQKANQLVEQLGKAMSVDIVEVVDNVAALDIRYADLLINTTPVGMNDDDPVLIEPEVLHADLLVYDLIYNPKETLLLQMAKKKGARTANGLGMLYYQGVLAFQRWAGLELDEKVKNIMRQALQRAAESL